MAEETVWRVLALTSLALSQPNCVRPTLLSGRRGEVCERSRSLEHPTTLGFAAWPIEPEVRGFLNDLAGIILTLVLSSRPTHSDLYAVLTLSGPLLTILLLSCFIPLSPPHTTLNSPAKLHLQHTRLIGSRYESFQPAQV
jgi:hypothetical protein